MLNLADPLLKNIIDYLPNVDRIQFSQVSKQFRDIISNQGLLLKPEINKVVDVEKNVDEKSTGYKVTKSKSKKSAGADADKKSTTAAATSSCSVSFDKKFVPLTPTQLSKKREKVRVRFKYKELDPKLRDIENEVDPVESK